MKRILTALLFLTLTALIYAYGSPRVYIQRCSLDSGGEAVSNTGVTTDPNYLVIAYNSNHAEALRTDIGSTPSMIRIYREGIAPNTYTATYVQLGYFPTQWEAGDIIMMYVLYIPTGESTSWNFVLPPGITTINIQSPVKVIPPATLDFIWPGNGAILPLGSIREISWESDLTQPVFLSYSTDGGNNWEGIGYVGAGQSSLNWVVPYPPSSVCKLKIVYWNNPSVFAVSDGFFSIVECSPALYAEPASLTFGDVWVNYNSQRFLTLTNTGDFQLEVTLALDSDCFFLPEDRAEGDRTTQYYRLDLPSGQSAQVAVEFVPPNPGWSSASISVTTDFPDLPAINIPLSGNGTIIPPKPPENLRLEMQGLNVILSWDPVRENIVGQPLTPDYYTVWFCPSGIPAEGNFVFLMNTTSLSAMFEYNGYPVQKSFYRVTAIKS